MCIAKTNHRHLQDLGPEVSLEFFTAAEILEFTEAFRKFSFVPMLIIDLVSETANIQTNLIGWSHSTGLSRTSREAGKPVVGPRSNEFLACQHRVVE